MIVGALDLVSDVLVAEFMQEWCSRVNDIGRTQGARHTPILPWGQNRPKNPTHIHKQEEILSPNPTHLNNYVSRGWTKNRLSWTKNQLFSSFLFNWNLKLGTSVTYYMTTNWTAKNLHITAQNSNRLESRIFKAPDQNMNNIKNRLDRKSFCFELFLWISQKESVIQPNKNRKLL